MRFLHWLIVGLTVLLIALLLAFRFAIPRYDKMLRDFGAERTPFVRLVLSGWPPLGFAAAAAACLGLGLRPRASHRQRRAYALAAAVIAGGGLVVCLAATSVDIRMSI